MDAYYTNRFVEVLVPYIKNKSLTDGLYDLLQKAGLDAKQAVYIATMSNPFRRIRSLVQQHLERYPTQTFNRIDELFLCFGIKDFSQNVEKKTGRKTLRRSIELLVQRRHEIVHRGDLNLHLHLQRISPKLILRRLKDMNTFVWHSQLLLRNII